LALQMGRQLADFDAGLGAEPLELVAVGLAFGGALQVQALRSERWQLNPAIAERGRPARQVRQVVERRLRPEKLRKEDGRSTNGRTASTAGCRGLLHLGLLSFGNGQRRPLVGAVMAGNDRLDEGHTAQAGS